MELALAQESAEQNAAQLQAPSQTTTQVNKLGGHPNPKASNGKKSFGTCHRCGGKHMQKDCPFKEAECHKCKKKGHLARVCRSKTKQTKSNAAPRQARAQNSTHHMEEIETTDEQSTYTLFNVTTNACRLLQVTIKVNDIDLTMEVDTVVSMSLISNATFRNCGQHRVVLHCYHLKPNVVPTRVNRLMYWRLFRQMYNLNSNKKPYLFY